MSTIRKLSYVEKDAKVWVVTDVLGKPVQYIYKDVPLSIWNRLNALYKQASGSNVNQLHGMIWSTLRKYSFDKTESKLTNNIQMKLAGV